MQEFLLKNLMTIIVVIFLLYGTIEGFINGFVKKIISFGSLVLTIILTKYISPSVVAFIKDVTNIEATLTDKLYSAIMKTSNFENLIIPGLDKIFNTEQMNEAIKNSLCINIANSIINLVSVIIVFIGIFILLKIIIKFLDIVDYIPIVGQLNKILGAIVGLIEFLIIVWIVFLIIRILSNIPQIKTIIENIESSAFLKILYDNNIIYNFVSNIFSFNK